MTTNPRRRRRKKEVPIEEALRRIGADSGWSRGRIRVAYEYAWEYLQPEERRRMLELLRFRARQIDEREKKEKENGKREYDE